MYGQRATTSLSRSTRRWRQVIISSKSRRPPRSFTPVSSIKTALAASQQFCRLLTSAGHPFTRPDSLCPRTRAWTSFMQEITPHKPLHQVGLNQKYPAATDTRSATDPLHHGTSMSTYSRQREPARIPVCLAPDAPKRKSCVSFIFLLSIPVTIVPFQSG